MKVALKYGLLITIGVIAWVVTVHLLVSDPNAKIHGVGAAFFFNLFEVIGLYLGITERQREENVLSFKTGIKTGIGIAFVYGLLASAFFCLVVLFIPQWVPSRMAAGGQPVKENIAGAFVGLFLGAVVMGTIYATVISFLVVRSQRERNYT